VGIPQKSLSVVHVSQSTDAGVGSYVATLALDQVGRSWDVTVVCPPVLLPDHTLAKRAQQSGARAIQWRATRSPGMHLLSETIRLRRILRALPADIVHFHSSKAGLAGRLAVRGRTPTVFQPNAWSFWALSGPLRRLAVHWERMATRWTDMIICVSEGELLAATEAGFGSIARLVPNAVDLDALAPASAADRRRARVRLGLNDAPYVVCVGRLSHQKGQDVLLDAWATVKRSVPHARLVLVGTGPLLAELEARNVPDVEFVGFRDDVSEWLVAANVVAFPSRWEGMSFTLLEAMACARSVVTTDVPGVSELLDGGGGAVVPSENREALAAALIRRLRNSPKTDAEGAAGRRSMETTHGLDQMCQSVAEVYGAVLAERADSYRTTRRSVLL
jgi:glycosyltransferase involved in cell wall biosynthesis